ncbi:16S rRNA pseudouridine(516) synthase [Phreatobacter aquaticus]|uniref:Pseudouridine synthase n=1 Tax=Phreatobacter aquaticus TaxID=2570229 RepID=A0A4D7Q977_9HYPH|nr:16S rRNA pseudouridine(516) synthase [Phreatobacter aquaticus]QCK84690.1 16S rRNA pseudouridine(516) synthase [Phreatobacter aquaticus]
MSKGPANLRLDRLLANLGYGSRREVQGLVDAGLVKLDGVVMQDADQRIAITPDLSSRMVVRGRPLDPPPGMALMLHKPLGVTCSHKEAGPLIYSLLPDRWRRRDPAISTVGRLDKETSGLILLTDDGALLHRIISPKSNVPKRYLATLDRPLKGDEAQIFASGTLMLEGEDKPLLPAELEVISPVSAHVTVHEGRYHQVRRMFAALGNHVTALHRDLVGGLDLPEDLEPGQYRLLGEADVKAIFGKG